MTVADIPTFPIILSIGQTPDSSGLTYRQWLIGVALCGVASSKRLDTEMSNQTSLVAGVIALVDETISQLDAEV